jgi:DNA-binding MarR family transcriptional regulator
VAEIARDIGVTRQSVQRIADLLVAKSLAGYEPNPAHRRAKLLRATDRGREAVGRIAPGHGAFARRLTERVGKAELAELLERLRRLSVALDELAREGLPPE